MDDNKEMKLFLISDNPRAIEVLLSKGAKVNVQNFTGSPLLLATLLGHISCMKVLLAHNADVLDSFIFLFPQIHVILDRKSVV